MNPLLFIVSSPSGAGKTTIAKALLAARQDLAYSISATTRAPRAGEREGVDYHFLSPDEFARRRAAGEFAEWAEYDGHLYGTLTADLNRLLAGGRHVVLDIEVQGARQIRRQRSDAVSIFILPPSAEALYARLAGRSADAPEAVRHRLAQAVEEIRAGPEYDYVVVNDDQAQAVAAVAAIIDAEACRVRRAPELSATLERLQQGLEQIARRLAQE